MASLALAFATDSEISMKINQCSRLAGNLRALMKEICHYCTENELRFYAVFDQHNEISENDQDTYPYSLPTFLFTRSVPQRRIDDVPYPGPLMYLTACPSILCET